MFIIVELKNLWQKGRSHLLIFEERGDQTALKRIFKSMHKLLFFIPLLPTDYVAKQVKK